MNIIVLVKQIPDTESLFEVDTVNTRINTEDVKWVINPYDEFAIEEALQIKDDLEEGKITVLSMGPARCQTALRTALAMGADQAILIDDPAAEGSDALGTARVLTAAIGMIPFDLIIAGVRAVDDDGYQVPVTIAEYLDIPQISSVTKETIIDGTICCEQAVEGGFLEVEADLPILFTTQRGINEPRYVSLPDIMKAKKKPLTKMSLADIGVSADQVGDKASMIEILSLSEPPQRSAGKIIQGDTSAAKATELVRLLKEEAKVI